MECRFPSRMVWVMILFFISGLPTCLEAQGPKSKAEVIYLLEDSLSQARLSTDSARRVLKSVLDERDILKQESHKLREENRRMVFKIQDAESKSNHLEQTNAMFVLYTGIAAVVFLFTLLFIVVRKITSKPKVVRAVSSGQDVDKRIERLNALGNLRERGLLSDQEVEEQKRFLIGGN